MNWKECLKKIEINRLLLLGTFVLISLFIWNHWGIEVSDPYIILACFVLLVCIPLISRFDVVQYKDFTFKHRSVEDDIEKASKDEVKRARVQDEGLITQSPDNPRERISELRKLEERILKSYSGQKGFQKEVRLRLEENDSIADIESLIFDASYHNRKRRYFVMVRGHLSPFINDRIYRYLRIMKDISDKLYHNKLILKIAVIQREDRPHDVERFKRFFQPSIDVGLLEIDYFDKEGNKL